MYGYFAREKLSEQEKFEKRQMIYKNVCYANHLKEAKNRFKE